MSARHRAGRHFLQIPGPTNVPDRVLRAIAQPTIDHRGPEFAELRSSCCPRWDGCFAPRARSIVYPSSGTGAWEAALVNVLSPGDRVLAFETGHFALLWQEMATRLGLEVELVPGDWRHGVEPEMLAHRLAADRGHTIRAVMVVHNETSTGVTSRVAEVRAAIDAAAHPALLLVDAISSLASVDYRHDEWGVDVTVAGSQKGLMLPPGLGFNAVSAKALEAASAGRVPALLPRLGADHRGQPRRLLSLHTSDQPALRAAGGDRDARGGDAGGGVRTPPPPRRRPRAARCEPGASRCSARTSASTRPC